MSQIEIEIESIQNAYNSGQISREEYLYLLQEMRDVRAAQDCADNEVLFRRVVDICNVAIAAV